MPSILGANTLSSGYDVANSLRFDKPSDSYLAKTFSSAGSTRKFTFSTWLKGHDTAVHGSTYFFVGNINGSSNIDAIGITDSGIQISVNSATEGSLNSTALFRDFSAWYHFVIGVDTTQGTAANRVKVYINGTQITAWDTETYPDQNYDFTGINSTETHNVSYADSEHNGYLAETVFIDGTQYAASDFGEYDEDSPTVWRPKDVSGLTFGQNGFYLEYKGVSTGQNSNGLGADTSGNDHHFASSGLAAIDQTTDTPTNNYATLNPLLDVNAHPTYSEGNLKFAGTGSTNFAGATIPVSSGKWYCEVKCTTASGSYPIIGVIDSQSTMRRDGTYFVGSDASATNPSGFAVFTNGDIYHNGDNNFSNLTTTYGNGDIIGLALNMDAATKTLGFYKNGTLEVTVNLDAPPSGDYMFASAIHSSTSGAVGEFNFGNPSFSISSGNSDANGYGNFEHSVPSGYYALNSKNLAEYG